MENTDDTTIKQSIQEQTPDSSGSAAPEDTTPIHDSLTPSHDSSANVESATPASMEGVESSMHLSENGVPGAASGAEKPLAPEAPPRRRPRRTGQPLHLLLQDCARQHITGSLCKQSVDEIKAVLASKQSIASDLQRYSNETVLHSARDRVISEVDTEGKELLQDVDPARDIIRQRFEDEAMVFKSYDDAIHDIRVDLFDSKDDSLHKSGAKLNSVLQVWDPLYKRPEPETRRGGRTHVGPYPTRGGRPGGPPSSRPHPYNGRPPYRDPRGEPRGEPRGDPRGDPRGYHHEPRDYPYHDDYYGDRMEDYRRADYDRRDPRGPPPPPGARNSPYPPPRDMRDARDYRERPPPPAPRHEDPYSANRFDDRRRGYDGGQPPVPGPRDSRSGLLHAASPSLASHPSLPPKPTVSAYMPGVQTAPPGSRINGRNQPQPPHQPPPPQPTLAPAPAQPQAYAQAAAAYPGYAQPATGYSQGYADPNAYAAYGYYGQDPNAAAAAVAAQQAYYGQAGWDMTQTAATNVAAVGAVAGAGLNLQPFTSGQHGRHKAVPLPTDFMSGPSEAPRLSMPEPHEVLGVIRGVIIRDAQGNIGLSQYTFTRSS
ncbi:hypothetical protein DFQ26_006249 [Actinomortierella ambigua]|nr:hypothetical protein DFQ26_006249 [Actinomortierella ambigua]